MHRRLLPLILIAALPVLNGCGGQSGAAVGATSRPAVHGSQAAGTIAAFSTHGPTARSAAPAHPQASSTLVVTPVRSAGTSWQPAAMLGGQVAAWEAERLGVRLLRFDQSLVALTLHAGLGEPPGTWKRGDRIGPDELHRVIAAFNGGFKFETGVVGYMSEGHVAVRLRDGRASIVTYRNGTTQIGTWGAGLPERGQTAVSVLQNLKLLVDHGRAAATVGGCIQSCWGSTVGGVNATARSALGIDGNGRLIWAAGGSLRPAQLAHALVAAGAQRAVELDINPDWVAGYLYTHGAKGPHPVPVVPGQLGITGYFLAPYTRDFFVINAR